MDINKVVDKRIKEIGDYCDIQFEKHLNYIVLVLKEMYYRGQVDGLKALDKRNEQFNTNQKP